MSNRMELPFGRHLCCISLPEDWRPEVIRLASPPPLSDQAMIARLNEPVGGPRLREAARGAHRAVIVVDDATRPTPAQVVAEWVVGELESAGVDGSRIAIVGAIGLHSQMTHEEFVAKVGSRIAGHYAVESHDYRDRLTFVGTTSAGTPVWLNETVVAADLRISIGAVLPHDEAGSGGGAKILLPGVAGLETVAHNHITVGSCNRVLEPGVTKVRQDIEEVLGMVPVHFSVNVLIDEALRIVGLRAGDPLSAHRLAFKDFLAFALLGRSGLFDVVIANSYPFDMDLCQATKALPAGLQIVRPGGTLIWAAACYRGLGHHELAIQNDAYRSMIRRDISRAARERKIYFYSPGLQLEEARVLLPEEVEVCDDIEVLLRDVARMHPGKPTVAVLPAAPLFVTERQAAV
ncbi:MAG: lactate racemase domain-containing protein [Bacillota bacterium]